MSSGYPAYLGLLESGELARRVQLALESLADCALCGRVCHADRLHGGESKSFCRSGRYASVSSVFPHHGEESCLRGSRGSGTIFFSHCNLRCVFCQNFDISHFAQGRPVVPEELADLMLELQGVGCHNINFVTPSHVVAQMLEGLLSAAQRGLRLPIVCNTGGYDRVETLRLLDGVVDIYMPDFKFWDADVSSELANAEDYRQVVCSALMEMHRQVGDLELDDRGIAHRGLLVRHLVMPGSLDDTRRIMRFLAREISADTFVNVMPQYHPAGRAHRHASINRPLRTVEYREALLIAQEEGLRRFNRR